MRPLPCDARTASAIGVDWLLAAIAPAGEFGRERREVERVFKPGDESAAEYAISTVVKAASTLEPDRVSALRRALASVPDPRAILDRASAQDILDDVDFFELTRFFESLAPIRSLSADDVFAGIPTLVGDPFVEEMLAPGRMPQRTFFVADAFDPELAEARARAEEAQAAYDLARTHLVEGIAAALGLDSIRDGEFVLMRDLLRGPLPPNVRVLHEASTYLSCEVQLDEPTLDASGKRDQAATVVADFEERVRRRLSREIAAAAERLHATCDALGLLDSFVSRVAFAAHFPCVVPEIVGAASIAFEAARFLPLEQVLREEGRDYEPISLELESAGVLTGPNMGGKSAALRTCGFLAMSVALGLPVAAKGARLGLFDDIGWIGITAADADANAREAQLLSAFGSEVMALRAFFERGGKRGLLLADEFARTTSPHEGRALLIALLERLRERGFCGLAATHLHGVAGAAGVAHYAIVGLKELPQRDSAPLDLAGALERIGRAMDYRIVRVDGEAPPRADALALADVLGLDPEIVARARAAL